MASQTTRSLSTTIADNVRSGRVEKGLTQAQLAHLVGVDVGSVSRWERGLVMPTLENLVGLAVAFGRDAAWFYVDHAGAEIARAV